MIAHFTALLAASAASASALGANMHLGLRRSTLCPNTPPSCQNSTSVPDLCCFESPGGMIALVQFWDTAPPAGPSNSWTIHGLWPDNCDGTWAESCDPNRFYPSITNVLQDNGKDALLEYMNTYWVSNDGNEEKFWEHEWNKHGTCYSTLAPTCLPQGSPAGADAAAFFQFAVNTFQSLPTYDWLASAGIQPTQNQRFRKSDFVGAIRQSWGYTPGLDCHGGAVNQIQYYFNLQGSLLDGQLIPIDAPQSGSCHATGLRYPPKPGTVVPANVIHVQAPTS